MTTPLLSEMDTQRKITTDLDAAIQSLKAVDREVAELTIDRDVAALDGEPSGEISDRLTNLADDHAAGFRRVKVLIQDRAASRARLAGLQ